MTQQDRVRRLAWVVWTVLVTLAVGRAGLYHLPRHQGCYSVFADGGRHWLYGEDLYDSEHPNNLVDAFRYSPLTAVALVPLAWVPDPLGSALLRAASIAVFLLGLGWWARAGWPRGGPAPQPALLFLLCAAMVSSALMDVQLNLLTIGFMLLTVAAAARARWNTAALAAALAVSLKAYPVSLALVLALVFPRRFAGRWLGMMALCLGLPFLLQSPEYVLRQYGDWIRWGLNQRHLDAPSGGFQDLMLLCRCWLVPVSRETYLWLEVGAGAAIALVCWLCRRLPQQELLHCVFGLCCAWMMVLGPATEAATYIQLAPAVAAAVLSAWTTPAQRWYRGAVTASLVILVLAQAQLLFPLDKPLHRVAAQPFAALLMLLAVAVHALSRRPSAPAEENQTPRRQGSRTETRPTILAAQTASPAARGGRGRAPLQCEPL